jgi:hypothetical protein
MNEPLVGFTVTCPECGVESIGTFRLAARTWDASDVEQAQIREYLAAMWREERSPGSSPDRGSHYTEGSIV